MDEKGFSKIDLTPKEIHSHRAQQMKIEHAEKNHAMKTQRSPSKKLITFLVILLLIIVPGVIAGISINNVMVKGKIMAASARELGSALKKQDLDEAKTKLADTKTKLADTKKAVSSLAWTGFIPIVGSYYHDADHGLKAADAGLDALDISVNAILPYSDLLGLKGKGTFTGGSADQRLQLAITTFDKVTPKLAEISDKMEIVRSEIDQIDPNRYPEAFQGKQVRSQIVLAKSVTDEMSNLFISARPFLEQLPSIMGSPKPKKYVVLFLNDKELRPSGGFITAYAIFRMENGKPVVEKADDIYKLDDSRKKKTPAPPDILKYHKGVFAFNLRDSNISPDYLESVKNFESLYADVPDKIAYDGIITVDTHVLVEAMKILGAFEVYDRKFSAENDPRCNCPKVVYELEDYSSRPVAYVRSDRKDIIGVLLYKIMQTALGVSPGKYWGQLFQMSIKELNEKHIMVYLTDPKAQASLEKLNWSGRIQDFEGDYLHINDANMAGAKSDLFIKRSVKINYETKDANITKTITIDYKNPAEASNCNLEAGQLCLNGLLRDWIRVYTPKGSKLVDFKGSEMDPVVKEDLGKTVFEGFVTVKPLGASELVIEYTLPQGLAKNNTLPLLIQKQPGTDGIEYTILVNGKTAEKFTLLTDKQLQIKL